MDALSIYGKDKLFHNILKESNVILGHYFISASNGLDINSNNFDTVDPDWTKKQYPLAVCMIPKSTEDTILPSHVETMVFTLVFLRQTYVPQPTDTVLKIVDAWEDCEAMVKSGRQFMYALGRTISKNKNLRNKVSIVQGPIDITRVTRISQDRASGAVLVFKIQLTNSDCADTSSQAEYPINLPTLSV